MLGYRVKCLITVKLNTKFFYCNWVKNWGMGARAGKKRIFLFCFWNRFQKNEISTQRLFEVKVRGTKSCITSEIQ